MLWLLILSASPSIIPKICSSSCTLHCNSTFIVVKEKLACFSSSSYKIRKCFSKGMKGDDTIRKTLPMFINTSSAVSSQKPNTMSMSTSSQNAKFPVILKTMSKQLLKLNNFPSRLANLTILVLMNLVNTAKICVYINSDFSWKRQRFLKIAS